MLAGDCADATATERPRMPRMPTVARIPHSLLRRPAATNRGHSTSDSDCWVADRGDPLLNLPTSRAETRQPRSRTAGLTHRAGEEPHRVAEDHRMSRGRQHAPALVGRRSASRVRTRRELREEQRPVPATRRSGAPAESCAVPIPTVPGRTP